MGHKEEAASKGGNPALGQGAGLVRGLLCESCSLVSLFMISPAPSPHGALLSSCLSVDSKKEDTY